MNMHEVLAKHKKWIADEEGGQRADLRGADLQHADLRGADLQHAYLREAYLQDADLRDADLKGADLQDADLRGAYLKGADLRGADLRGAYLKGADLDFSCWPLWCGSRGVIVDLRIVYQLLAHVACLDCDELEFAEIKSAIMPWAVKSHRAMDLGLSTEGEA
jgi:uncharacterized protein YjbI with pentapeptide repeats